MSFLSLNGQTPRTVKSKRAKIVLINPRFEPSYWGLQYSLPLIGKRAVFPNLGLPVIAACTPAEYQVTLVDENVEAIDFDRLKQADIVGITGMNVQRRRMLEIIKALKRRNIFTVAGGPWVSVQEDYFDRLADVIFIGEAETTWPQFLSDWRQGRHQYRYEQNDFTNMEMAPAPRWDLVDWKHFMFGTIQISRGCPFQCEFCDIIVTFGRRPRVKTSEQVIAELDTLRKKGMKMTFIVDDNFIGNKKVIKNILESMICWQKKHHYPMALSTEASLDLAECPELMQLMLEANIRSVFIGVESPDEASLLETRKTQNVRPAKGSILERVHRIQETGLDVWGGMIVGFDNDDNSVFEAQRTFLQASRIPHASIGMLVAIPKTPLYDRLQAAGRLDMDDVPAFGTNIIPAKMSREELRDGWIELMWDLYQPEAYFKRVDELHMDDKLLYGPHARLYWHKQPWWVRLREESLTAIRCLFIYLFFVVRLPNGKLREEYRKRIRGAVEKHQHPTIVFVYLFRCLMHYHHYTMAEKMMQDRTRPVNLF